MNKNTISILGCGWLGLPLAKKLVNQGYLVKGSSTSETKLTILQEWNIKPYLIKFKPDIDGSADFFDAATLIVSIPPSLRNNSGEYFIQQVLNLANCISFSSISNVIYTSSTSIYPELNREMHEDDITSVESSASPFLYRAEEIFSSLENQNVTILRLGGLTGYDRLLVKYFAGKKGLTNGNEKINLLHRDDAIDVLINFISSPEKSGIYNVVSPAHPTKSEFYTFLAKKYGLEQPEFIENASPWKTISASKLIKELNFKFKFPDPFQFSYLNQL
ncbi:MAG: SDR family NAD(P)-dependent oxidoreductase [Cytophagaceae bacterium]